MPKIKHSLRTDYRFYTYFLNFRNTKSLALRKNLYICMLKITPLGKNLYF